MYSLFIMSICLITFPLYAIEPLTPISFLGGIDYSKICSEVDPERACDSSNMYGDRQGSAEVRFGSHRMNAIAVSTQPFSALYSTVISSAGNKINLKIGVSGDTIYYSTDAVFTKWFILYSGLTTHNQRFTFAPAQNSIYMTGNALTDPIFKYDAINSSFSLAILSPSTWTAVIFAKYVHWENGYMLAGNVRDVRNGLTVSTTYYDDRVYYSYVLQPSSFSVDRFLNVNPGDNDSITGLTSKRTTTPGTSLINAYKSMSVYGIVYSILNPKAEGGDQQIVRLAEGFGHVGMSPPENIGTFDIVTSMDGILQWNGGLLSRDKLEAEKVPISGRLKTLINNLIIKNTYKESIIKYYPKSNYLVWAYKNPEAFTGQGLNSAMFYDLLTGEWWPMRNWIVGSLETDKETGALMYGDGMDGYSHIVDDPIDSDDSRKEISIDPMEKTNDWRNAGITTNTVAVGTASLTLVLNSANTRTSSITKVAIMPLGEWYDKTAATETDKISFKVAVSSPGLISRIRVDLQVEDVQAQFNTNFSSVVISSNSLLSGSSVFTTVEISFSSFPLLAAWTDFETESVPFAKNLTRFGIRFVATATADATLFFDDVRFVQATKNPLNPSRTSKLFNLDTLSNKDWKQIVLTREKTRDSSFFVDVLTGQGILTNTKEIPKEINKELYVCGHSSTAGIVPLSSIDLNVVGKGTATVSRTAFDFAAGVFDGAFIYAYDSENEKLVKIDIASFTAFISTYGSLGAGATNTNYVQDIAVESDPNGNLLIVDHMNHRLKEHRKKDFSFVREYGQLGRQTTSFYNPTSADWDKRFIWVGDDSNQRIALFDREYNFIREVKLDINTIGNLTVKAGSEYLFDAYTRGADQAIYFTDVVVEKRINSSLDLMARKVLRPEGVVISSTYSLRGFALFSKFVYVLFNDSTIDDGTFYFQKLLQSDLSLVQEKKLSSTSLNIIGDGLAREPSKISEVINLEVLPSPYLQLKFYSKNQLESLFKLIDMALVVAKQPYIP